jgi:hypothetical protein
MTREELVESLVEKEQERLQELPDEELFSNWEQMVLDRAQLCRDAYDAELDEMDATLLFGGDLDKLREEEISPCSR